MNIERFSVSCNMGQVSGNLTDIESKQCCIICSFLEECKFIFIFLILYFFPNMVFLLIYLFVSASASDVSALLVQHCYSIGLSIT